MGPLSTRLLAFLLLLLPPAPAFAGDVTIRLDTGAGLSVRDDTGAVQRLRVDEATGNVSRNGALFVHTTGTDNTFVGSGAGNVGLTGSRNSAFGANALLSNTTGYFNTAMGADALRSNTSGGRNTAFGNDALRSATTTVYGSAFGESALRSNTTGPLNTAFGAGALRFVTTGCCNTAVGTFALYSSTGASNTAVGRQALGLATTAIYNVAVGNNAGVNQTTGSNNIYIANNGVAGESGQIKIGTAGNQTAATIAGIVGATSAGGIAVLVNASGKLGTTTSSARFKEDVRDMGDASDLLMRLRPVTFRYTEETVGKEESKTTRYGLIAEEVARVAPELTAPDLDGRPYSVKYHELPALLLNEVQSQRRTIATLEARIAELEK